MKWHLVIIGLLLLGYVGSVGAWTDTFQGTTATSYAYTGGLGSAQGSGCPFVSKVGIVNDSEMDYFAYDRYCDVSSGESSRGILFLNAGFNNGYLVGYPSDYFAWTDRGTYFEDPDGHKVCTGTVPMDVYLYDSSSVKISEYNIGTDSCSHPNSRFEIKRNPDNGNVDLYIDGAYIRNLGATGTRPWMYAFSSSIPNIGTSSAWLYALWRVDDIIQETSSSGEIVGTIPPNWYIKKDMLGATVDGLYNQYNQSVRTTYFDSTYGSDENLNTQMQLVDHGGRVWESVNITGYSGTARFNLTHFTASEAPFGLYQVTIAGSTAFENLWYIGTGATLSWDKKKYSLGETAKISYDISDAYFDTTTYSYKIVTIDQYGAMVGTNTSVTTKSGSVNVELSSPTYPAGLYYAELIATVKSSGAEIVMNYAATEVVDYILFSGYVMNAETGATLPNANVNVTQGTLTATSQSLSTGAWNSSNNWLSGTPITLDTSLTGYTSDLLTIVPLTAKSVLLNISLIPDPATTVGTSIGGIVRDNVYSNPIPDALVTVQNGTESYTSTTNIAGFYRVDNLYSGRLYDVWSSKLGYGNSTVAKKLAVGV